MAPVAFTPTTVTNPIGVQGSYPFTSVAAHEGMLANMNSYDTLSGINQSSAALPFGALIQLDTTGGREENAVILSTGATNNLGILIDSFTFEGVASGNASYLSTANGIPGTNLAADGRPGYPQRKSLNILRRGQIFVFTTEAVNLGSPVRFWDTDHSGTVAGAFVGRFCTTQSTTRTTLITNGARWLTRTTGAGLAILEIEMAAATFTADV
jgi:hypothetical protein